MILRPFLSGERECCHQNEALFIKACRRSPLGARRRGPSQRNVSSGYAECDLLRSSIPVRLETSPASTSIVLKPRRSHLNGRSTPGSAGRRFGFATRAQVEATELASQRPAAGGGIRSSEICFGPFRLLPEERLLLEADRTVRIGSRALDILIAMVECPGQLVSKEELMAKVWPNLHVEPANLTVHVAALRRLLGDGRNGNRYLINIPGRGYRFVAGVSHTQTQTSSPEPVAIAALPICLPGSRDWLAETKL